MAQQILKTKRLPFHLLTMISSVRLIIMTGLLPTTTMKRIDDLPYEIGKVSDGKRFH